ncbi:hypothetical protein RDV89_00895 [Nocardioides zeae]|uniref:Uncharacterized protein n=1 Tax=Nocardioides imazamoxiresistens TaxID=3231893 RepID=A0ABU3PQV2_9ACTN|nr:hypothetical protein [Nocardioides zeae]MDT9591603.1 hypothetical protein [Nocardioides zeae]
MSAALAQEMGDNGPWVRHVRRAWRMCGTAATDDVRTPPKPRTHSPDDWDAFGRAISYAAAPLHLLVYGLGWSRPDLGLAAWHANGFASGEPVLDVVARWWRPSDVEDILMWAPTEGSYAFQTIDAQVRDELGLTATPFPGPLRDSELWQRRRTAPIASTTWQTGGYEMHLPPHLRTPLEEHFDDGSQQTVDFRPGTVWAYGPGRCVLVVDNYGGWYRKLFTAAPDAPVDVSVRTTGWMGTYEKSPTTKLMHRTSEEVHLWGHPPVA